MNFTNQYLKIIKTDLNGLNLTRIVDPKEFHEKQFLDSVMPFKLSTKVSLDDNIHVDIGFGGGFPCLPLLSEFKHLNFKSFGFEAREKKVNAVNLIAKKLKLNNFRGFHFRLEQLLIDKKSIITLKAVGKISEFLSKINVSNNEVKVVFY